MRVQVVVGPVQMVFCADAPMLEGEEEAPPSGSRPIQLAMWDWQHPQTELDGPCRWVRLVIRFKTARSLVQHCCHYDKVGGCIVRDDVSIDHGSIASSPTPPE
jgi:hypothetical protein